MTAERGTGNQGQQQKALPGTVLLLPRVRKQRRGLLPPGGKGTDTRRYQRGLVIASVVCDLGVKTHKYSRLGDPLKLLLNQSDTLSRGPRMRSQSHALAGCIITGQTHPAEYQNPTGSIKGHGC